MKKQWGFILFLLLFAAGAVASASPAAQTITAPNPADYKLTQVVSGLTKPVLFTHAGDNTGRQFIVEQTGKIKIWQNGAVLPTPFLDVGTLIATGGSEQGLLGLAFAPNFAQSGQFYINYTNTAGDTIIARYTVSPANGNVANAASATQVLFVDQPYANHNGGNLNFGKDGLLYVGMGDGGSGGDPQNNAQNPASLLGKILRIDVSKTNFPVQVWALGVRNPWRWSFDRLTGDFYMGDVGQDMYEEVDFYPANGAVGANYGWNIYEGFHNYKAGTIAGAISPIAEYDHSQGCSITGGYVYRGVNIPALQGFYFYADFCNGNMWTAFRNGTTWQSARFLSPGFSLSSFGEDQAGELYVVDYSGKIWRLDSAKAAPTNTAVVPTKTNTPLPPTATVTLAAPTKTKTPLPPTVTNTPIPATKMATPIIPTKTNTPAAPTQTSTVVIPTKTVTPTATAIVPTKTAVPATPTLTATVPTTTGAAIRISVIPTTADIGKGVLAAVGLENVSNVYGIQLTCKVNPAVLTGTGLLKGDGFNDQNSFVIDQGYKPDGSWVVAASRLQPNKPISGSILAFTLGYTVSGTGDTTIECSALVVDADGSEIPVTVISGAFKGSGPVITQQPTAKPTLTATPTVVPTQTAIPSATPSATATTVPVTGSISGVAAYQGRSNATGITIMLLGGDGSVLQQIPADATGQFTFSNLAPGTYGVGATGAGYLTLGVKTTITADSKGVDVGTLTLRAGDVDGNQTIDLADAAFIGANFNNPVPPSPDQADLNKDKVVNIRDLVLVGSNYGLKGPIVVP